MTPQLRRGGKSKTPQLRRGGEENKIPQLRKG
jgi:hypothetical protein